MRQLLLACVLPLALLAAGGADAAPVAPVSPEQAVALVREAARFLEKNGKDKAIAEFNKPSGPFVGGDFYIVLSQLDGVIFVSGVLARRLKFRGVN